MVNASRQLRNADLTVGEYFSPHERLAGSQPAFISTSQVRFAAGRERHAPGKLKTDLATENTFE